MADRDTGPDRKVNLLLRSQPAAERVSRNVELHGSPAEVEGTIASHEGEGSTFILRLPAAPADCAV